MRLCDALFLYPLVPMQRLVPYDDLDGFKKWIKDSVSEAVIVKADEVADLVEKTHHGFELFGFPTYRLPYNPILVEFRKRAILFSSSDDGMIDVIMLWHDPSQAHSVFIHSLSAGVELHEDFRLKVIHLFGGTRMYESQEDAMSCGDTVTTTFMWAFDVAWTCVNLMHCKNVRVLDGKIGEFERRSFREKHKRSMLTFKTLEIEPMKKILRREGNIEANGIKKALHICRGHFATYDEKPLFGRVRGTFWVPQHVKGSATQGTIVKDYKVKFQLTKPST